jgi:Zn-dependent peptidase ImmA (M78 family)
MHVGLWMPVCVYDLSMAVGMDVRFLSSSSIEGLYCKNNQVILVSALRPAGRQVYNCAHELGHHVFRHGSILVDECVGVLGVQSRRDPQEVLADLFAGFLLMPKSAVEHAFAVRGWSLRLCTPLQVYTIAGWLGVGYTTLLDHMASTLHLITLYQARELKKIPPKAIRAEYLKRETRENLIIVDAHWSERAIDVHVGDLVQLPADMDQEGDFVSFQEDNQRGCLFCAVRQGVGRFFHPTSQWAVSVRVSRKNFVGRAQYRHQEDPDND